jgi:hypothetical protein
MIERPSGEGDAGKLDGRAGEGLAEGVVEVGAVGSVGSHLRSSLPMIQLYAP